MTKVFLSGSRAISRLPRDIIARLDSIIAQGHEIITGDANGVDKAIQRYFFARSYDDVTIYHIGEVPRNNVGNWRSVSVEVTGNLRGRDLYTQKDKRMAEIADCGMVIWDGKSSGSVQNMIWVIENNRASLVYLANSKEFVKIRNKNDLGSLLDRIDVSDRAEIDRKIGVDEYIAGNRVLYSQEAWEF